MAGRFEGRVALITGAGGAGIGSASARKFAGEGAAIVAFEHHEKRSRAVGDALRGEFDVPVLDFHVDIADRVAVDAAIAEASSELGTIDILVNNAAINEQGSVFEYAPDTFDEVITIDLNANWYMIRALIGDMREIGRGSIVNVTSVAAYNGGRGREGPYSAAKAGMNEITRSVAIEAGPYGIRCNAVAPGLLESKFLAKHRERLAVEADNTPLRRFGRPDEIASVIAFLASDDSSYITGEVINVSGGWLMRA